MESFSQVFTQARGVNNSRYKYDFKFFSWVRGRNRQHEYNLLVSARLFTAEHCAWQDPGLHVTDVIYFWSR